MLALWQRFRAWSTATRLRFVLLWGVTYFGGFLFLGLIATAALISHLSNGEIELTEQKILYVAGICLLAGLS